MSLENDITKIQEDMFKPASMKDLKARRAEINRQAAEFAESKYGLKVGDYAQVKGMWILGPIIGFEAGASAEDVYVLIDAGAPSYIGRHYIANVDKIPPIHEEVVKEQDDEDDEIFAPASGEEIEQRKGEFAHQEYLRKKKRSEETKKRYASIPFSYEDIIQLPEYRKIMGLSGVTDITTPIQKQHKNTMFRLALKPRGRTPYDRYKDYGVFSNGYVRYVTPAQYGDTSGVLKKFDSVNDIKDYAELLDFLYPVMKRKWDKAHARELMRSAQEQEMQKKEIALEILRMINYPIEDHWRYDSNLNYSEIKAIYDRLRG